MAPPDLIGNYEEREFPKFRNPTIDTLIWGSKRHHISVLLEIDVTDARVAIRAQKRRGQRIGFTAWMVKCIAQAVSEHQSIQALRQGNRRLVIFDDVDVAILVERTIAQSDADETLPMPYLIRKANEKTIATLHAELSVAKQQAIGVGEVQISSPRITWLTKLFIQLPRILRDLLFWQPVFRNPFRFKQSMGTVGMTVIGMSGQSGMSWGIPIGIHPLIVAVGAIAKRPGAVHDQIVIREYVGMTILFDHDVTDGAPVARFIRRLQELMADSYGLQEAEGVAISEEHLS
ncbi:2-oxo acid dehydrogenase subunit E2 [Cyanobacteria bacterium FACHB-63]|nr:2-oxo acid dehydrogenase subunit E2 [Cyanobacteria bacterium FACHB-63]